ncbi:MAG: hypothetical protein PUE95_03220 [Lachnospiraceae bacterium]|nr:hypothetical protein [Lachnospiraceae bacterium]
MSIKSIEELRNIFLEFNKEIVKCVCEETKKRKNEQCEVWFCNTRNNCKYKVEVSDNQIRVGGKSNILDEYGSEFILYLWIECRNEKIAYFYKDIDTKTLNLHVIPGVIQHYSKKGLDEKIKIPVLEYEKEKQCLNMNNVPKVENKYLPFAEKFEECIWVPENYGNNAFFKLQKIKDFDILSGELRNRLKEIRIYANTILNKIEGIESNIRGGLGKGLKYGFIEWLMPKRNDTLFAFNIFHINYIEDAGIFTAYDTINITQVEEREENNENNRINARGTDENTVVVRNDIMGKNQENVYSFHFLMEKLYETATYIETEIKDVWK